MPCSGDVLFCGRKMTSLGSGVQTSIFHDVAPGEIEANTHKAGKLLNSKIKQLPNACITHRTQITVPGSCTCSKSLLLYLRSGLRDIRLHVTMAWPATAATTSSKAPKNGKV